LNFLSLRVPVLVSTTLALAVAAAVRVDIGLLQVLQ
jgi:hypothetical protein